MATSAEAGFSANIAISTDGGGTFNTVSEQADLTLTVEADDIDVTHFDSGGVSEFVPGPYSWNVSASGNLIVGDTGQTDVYDNITTNTQVDLRIRPSGSDSGDPEFTGTATITTWETSATPDGKLEFSMEASGAGALNKTTQ